MPKVKEEAWTLNSADTIAIPAANRSDGTDEKWADIWKYQVPTGQAHILKPSHHFSCNIVDSNGDAAANATIRLRIVIRDQSEGDEKTIYGPALYIASKEFQNRDKMAALALQADLAIEEKFFIVIQAYSDISGDYVVDVDHASTYFKLEMIRIRSTI